jgi:serine/threonine-protein kinase RsbT
VSATAEAAGIVVKVAIRADYDIVEARRRLRALAEPLSYSAADIAMIATAVSELARNILEYAREGEIAISIVGRQRRVGVTVIARDDGPGIVDLELAMRNGYSTSKGLGLGLPGSQRLVDEFEIESHVGLGTTVTLTKWAPRP